MKIVFILLGGKGLTKVKYKTKQMTELLDFLQSVKGSHVTVSDINNYFREKDIDVGMTTIYRNLEKLVSEGVVAKYVVDGTSSACIEYIGDLHNDAETSCYHCKCEVCGKIIHLQCDEVEHLREHICEHHNFIIDSKRTVFYGVCSQCKNKK